MAKVVPAQLTHIPHLAENLRKQDRIELVRAHQTSNVLDSLVTAYNVSDEDYRWCALNDAGEPFLIFGVAPDPHEERGGIVWLLGTDDIDNHVAFVLRRSRYYIAKMLEKYRVIHNWVDADNHTSLSWLVRWCGFTRLDTYELNGHPFIHIGRTDTCANP